MAVKWKKDSVKAMREQREAAAKAEAMTAIWAWAFMASALAAGEKLAEGTILKDGAVLYRVVQAGGVTPQEHQPPHGEGMLAVYRPIDQSHAGTLEDPIPWVYGMDCHAGVYFSYQGHIYQVAEGGDMVPCVWAPGTAGLWQWVLIE